MAAAFHRLDSFEIMQVLNHTQITRKLKRLATEILERNFDAPEIILAGLNNNGVRMAEKLMQELISSKPASMEITLTRIKLNPANPLEYTPFIEIPAAELAGKTVIVVDDVVNSGRTLFYAVQPLLAVLPAKVEVAVLVERKHKNYPIQSDYVGLSLATTVKDDIDVQMTDASAMGVYLR
jgi:pyrimidine operon attenuation protein / uracil phosphoribosyltransferase